MIYRVKNEAEYILKTKETLRNVAKEFKVSKSTVHKDVSERLSILNPDLASKIRLILDKHLMERHINGGRRTKERYQKSY